MTRQFLYIALLFLASTSCTKNKNTSVQFDFQTELNGEVFDMSNTFTNSQGDDIRFELMKFYLGEISFINLDGEKTEVSDIELIDLGQDGLGSFLISVPQDDYSGIQFGIGVPEALNESDPSEFSESGHPLNITQSTFWGMNSMYRFVMIDGRYDLEPDGTFDGVFSYHTGHNDAYREISFSKELNLKKVDNFTLLFSIELITLLEGNGGSLDYENEPNYHGDTDDQHLSTTMSDNFVNSISVN
jgi:hypothetical protein